MPNFSRKHRLQPQMAALPPSQLLQHTLIEPMPYNEDSEIRYVANHLNDNLKMLLYLVDADKLKKVQNILFGKHSRMSGISRKTHMSKHHCHHMNPTKSKRFHQGMLGALPPAALPPHNFQLAPEPAAVPGFAPRMQHTHALEPVAGAPPPAVFIPSYQQHIKHLEKAKAKNHKLTRKHIHNHHMKNTESNINHRPINHN